MCIHLFICYIYTYLIRSLLFVYSSLKSIHSAVYESKLFLCLFFYVLFVSPSSCFVHSYWFTMQLKFEHRHFDTFVHSTLQLYSCWVVIEHMHFDVLMHSTLRLFSCWTYRTCFYVGLAFASASRHQDLIHFSKQMFWEKRGNLCFALEEKVLQITLSQHLGSKGRIRSKVLN